MNGTDTPGTDIEQRTAEQVFNARIEAERAQAAKVKADQDAEEKRSNQVKLQALDTGIRTLLKTLFDEATAAIARLKDGNFEDEDGRRIVVVTEVKTRHRWFGLRYHSLMGNHFVVWYVQKVGNCELYLCPTLGGIVGDKPAVDSKGRPARKKNAHLRPWPKQLISIDELVELNQDCLEDALNEVATAIRNMRRIAEADTDTD